MSDRGGALVVSLDFELHWGIRDHSTVDQYRENLLGVREAVPALLSLFAAHEIHATWATVGLLFCETKDELLAALPAERPRYADPRLSPYDDLDTVGRDEADDPFHFAPSLIRRIAQTPHQEIATHTFSHYYCLEPGQSERTFDADLAAAIAAARKLDVPIESIVFPRNQVNDAYLAVCARHGITTYRGNASSWFLDDSRAGQRLSVRRAARLVDTYLPIVPRSSFSVPRRTPGMPINVRASRFFRPYSRKARWLEPLKLRRFEAELAEAAENGRVYHLWWHPHNFGINLRENLATLGALLDRYDSLRRSHGMVSLSMRDVGARATSTA